jgi:hypothetical protein
VNDQNAKPGRKAAFNRRDILRFAAATLGGLAVGPMIGGNRAAIAAPPKDRKLLFVITAAGGASIIDSFLPLAASEAGANAATIIAYPDAALKQINGSNIRHVINLGLPGLFKSDYDIGTFVTRHKDDMAIVTQETTSVNHVVAQKRALTGANINRGRTVMEAVSEIHGEGLVLPNVNLAGGSYVEPGDDPTIPTHARAEVIANPLFFPLSTDGSRGIKGAPKKSLVDRARAAREKLEAKSSFLNKFSNASMLKAYDERRNIAPSVEQADLLSKLLLLPEAKYQLSEYDLVQSPMLSRMLEVFPNLGNGDAMEAQAATGFLMAYYGLSAAVTMGPTFVPEFLDNGTIIDTPLIFDFSHSNHVVTQNVMWARMMKMLDGLVTLLKEEDYMGDPSLGKMWDRSFVYVATDFGRTKNRPANALEFGSGHDLSNGNLMLSPMLKGNRVYGGVDPATAKTYGFDPKTGNPDPGRVMHEGDIYSLICQAMGVDFTGRIDMSGLVG